MTYVYVYMISKKNLSISRAPIIEEHHFKLNTISGNFITSYFYVRCYTMCVSVATKGTK